MDFLTSCYYNYRIQVPRHTGQVEALPARLLRQSFVHGRQGSFDAVHIGWSARTSALDRLSLGNRVRFKPLTLLLTALGQSLILFLAFSF